MLLELLHVPTAKLIVTLNLDKGSSDFENTGGRRRGDRKNMKTGMAREKSKTW
jgi:hypothetical protein